MRAHLDAAVASRYSPPSHLQIIEHTEYVLKNLNCFKASLHLEPATFSADLSDGNVECMYRPFVMSGGHYDLQREDIRLHRDDDDGSESQTLSLDCAPVIMRCGVSYNGVSATVGRTYFVDPTPAQQSAYSALLAVREACLAACHHGKRLSAVYDAATSVLKNHFPDLQSKFLPDCGSVLALTMPHRPILELKANNQRVMRKGQLLQLRVGFCRLERAPGDLGQFSVFLEDTICVGEKDSQFLTLSPCDLSSISYQRTAILQAVAVPTSSKAIVSSWQAMLAPSIDLSLVAVMLQDILTAHPFLHSKVMQLRFIDKEGDVSSVILKAFMLSAVGSSAGHLDPAHASFLPAFGSLLMSLGKLPYGIPSPAASSLLRQVRNTLVFIARGGSPADLSATTLMAPNPPAFPWSTQILSDSEFRGRLWCLYFCVDMLAQFATPKLSSLLVALRVAGALASVFRWLESVRWDSTASNNSAFLKSNQVDQALLRATLFNLTTKRSFVVF